MGRAARQCCSAAAMSLADGAVFPVLTHETFE